MQLVPSDRLLSCPKDALARFPAHYKCVAMQSPGRADADRRSGCSPLFLPRLDRPTEDILTIRRTSLI